MPADNCRDPRNNIETRETQDAQDQAGNGQGRSFGTSLKGYGRGWLVHIDLVGFYSRPIASTRELVDIGQMSNSGTFTNSLAAAENPLYFSGSLWNKALFRRQWRTFHRREILP